jgi:hypothetical protein
MPETIFTVGIVGHRHLSGEDAYIYVQSCCHRILSELRAEYPKIRAISALSQGADSIFAQTAVSLNIPLESVIPFDDFRSDFTEGVPGERYRTLRKRSYLETRVHFSKRSNLAYKRSMEWVVFKSNIVIAVWDGKKAGSVGGTWETILLCEKLRKTMIIIDVRNKTMSRHFDQLKNSFSREGNPAENIARQLKK